MLRDNPKFVELIEEICVTEWVYRGAVNKKHIADIAADFFHILFRASAVLNRDNETSMFYIIIISITSTANKGVWDDIQRIE